MKKIFKIALLLVLTLQITSCDFDVENYQDIPTTDAYKSVQDVQNGMNGAYYALGTYRFYGNYVISLGDMASDIATGNTSSGHFANFKNKYVVSDTQEELEDAWNYGFKVVDRCVRTIKGGNDVIADKSLHLSTGDIADIQSYQAQCYALRALANFTLVNLFAYPYQAGRDNLGLPLVKDKPLEPFVKIERSTVGETYDFILEDIASAEELLAESGKNPNAFYMNAAAIQALKARVNMYMGNYDEAKTAALKAIDLKGKGAGDQTDFLPTNEIYTTMWTSLAITDEDIFTICKTEADNLSANALNTLYGSYGATLTDVTMGALSETDIRLQLTDPSSKSLFKYAGIPTSAATSNIPVFRKSEMSLIIAEVNARKGDISGAQNYLFYTAKRNEAIKAADELPATKDELLDFIAEEHIREFFGEGHRFYEARRLEQKITVGDGRYTNFDIAKFVFPIPAAEINAGFCTQQNEKWSDNLPK